ncbi:TerB family tellurite resistance protein [Szabonella alba]|uniref:TerB family tellurite resistance protein n=1 Tax=Szabonella alba TaxID=2804194 RepID=A0A8K0VEB0_9RHOB|nr:TerB family tellurite resistance protein [Szabonella alba]MBL4918230.1 TerB family tellurite resistance protein [Szabonella alba]
MFEAMLRRLAAPAPDPLTEMDARLALAALLVGVARADDDYAGVEIARIEAVLAHRYGLSAPEATALRRQAEILESEAADLVRFTRALKEAVPLGEREALLQAMWSVALADSQRHDAEDSQMRLIARLLGLNDRASAEARQRASRAADGE